VKLAKAAAATVVIIGALVSSATQKVQCNKDVKQKKDSRP